MHLGGGRTNATDDALFRFKRRFNRNSGTYPTFYIGKRVILAEAYEHLLDLRQSKGDLSKSDGRLQRYRGQPRFSVQGSVRRPSSPRTCQCPTSVLRAL